MASDTSTRAAVLDDPRRHAQLDPGGMHDAILSFPAQLRVSIGLAARLDWTAAKPTTPAGICLCGMGGSAIGGDLAHSYWEHESPIPFAVHRGYNLPAHINDHWFVIASSYSGNTEETLAAVTDAMSRGCRRILAITSGGQLAQLSEENGWPCILLPGGLMPRAALGYLFGAVMMNLANWGVSGNNPGDLVAATAAALTDAAAFLETRAQRLSRTSPFADNPAKQAAAVIAGRVILVWGVTGSTDVVATRFKTQLCENGKAMAFANVLTELCHNEIVGLSEWKAAAEHAAVVLLKSLDDAPGPDRQREAIHAQLQPTEVPIRIISAVGNSRLERLLSLVQFGDFLSYYTAIVAGFDPTPIDTISRLKLALADA